MFVSISSQDINGKIRFVSALLNSYTGPHLHRHSLWSSKHHLPGIATAPAPIRSASHCSPTWFVSHLAQCAGEHPTSGLPSKITKPILALSFGKNPYPLSAAYRRVCTPQMVSEVLWYPVPHSSLILAGNILPAPAATLSASLPDTKPLWLSQTISSTSEVLNQRLFCSTETISQWLEPFLFVTNEGCDARYGPKWGGGRDVVQHSTVHRRAPHGKELSDQNTYILLKYDLAPNTAQLEKAHSTWNAGSPSGPLPYPSRSSSEVSPSLKQLLIFQAVGHSLTFFLPHSLQVIFQPIRMTRIYLSVCTFPRLWTPTCQVIFFFLSLDLPTVDTS